MTIKIQKLETGKKYPLYHRYPRQNDCQGAYIELDLKDKSLNADWNGEIGNAIPFSVYYGHCRRYGVSPYMTEKETNDLMTELLPLANKVLAGYESVWDGNNYVADFTTGARKAICEIEEITANSCLNSENDVFVISYWDDWFIDFRELKNALEYTEDLIEFENDTKSNIEADGHILDVNEDLEEWAENELIRHIEQADDTELADFEKWAPDYMLRKKAVKEALTERKQEID